MRDYQRLGHQLKLKKMKKILITVFISALLFACNNEKKAAPGVELRVSQEQLAMWNGLKGKYALYAHKDAGISSVDQLAGKTLLIAFVLPTSYDVTAQGGDAKSMEKIDVDWHTGSILGTWFLRGMDAKSMEFVGDAMHVIEAFRMGPRPLLQNNPELYMSNLLEESDKVGFVLESMTDTLGLTKSPKLVRLYLEALK